MRTVLKALLLRRKFTVLAVVGVVTLLTASAAIAGSGVGGVFNLGNTNTVNAITNLVGSVPGASLVIDNNSTNSAATALNLQVEPGKTPMKVNSQTKVANLNADKLDGKNATQLGVNGLQIVAAESLFNSSSPKGATATCPAGKVVVGAGYNISGGTSGDPGSEVIDVVPDALLPGSTTVTAVATEGKPSALNWGVQAIATCATAP